MGFLSLLNILEKGLSAKQAMDPLRISDLEMHHLAVASEVYYLCPSFQLFAPSNTKKLVSKCWMNLINFRVFNFSISTACYRASMFLSLHVIYITQEWLAHQEKFPIPNGLFVVVLCRSIKFFRRI